MKDSLITGLSVVTTASFYRRKKRITVAEVDGMFESIRRAHGVSSGRNIFRHQRSKVGSTRWSALCFKFKATPSFLLPSTNVQEELCGYLLLVEYEKYVAVFASRLSMTSGFKSEHLAPVAMTAVEAAVAKVDAVFQKVRLRNMSVSRDALRNKTLEASDLSNVVGPAGSKRFAPQTFTVEQGGKSTSATPGTGRIAIRSDKVGLSDLIVFAEGVIDELSATSTNVSQFIRTFARPISLDEALRASRPITLSFDTSKLLDAVTGDNPAYRLVRNNAGTITELVEADFKLLLESLEQNFHIVGRHKIREIRVSSRGGKVGSISLNKTRIALRSLNLDIAATTEVENTSFSLGNDEDRVTLKDFLDTSNAPIVLFDDMALAYIDGSIFRDETLRDGGEDLLRYMHPEPTLAASVDEKGNFTPAQTSFDANTTFGVIERTIGAHDQILICDDLTDEWADFIGVQTLNGVTHVNFYHGKHGKLSLGASGFHVSVSQAIKNLGNMTFPPDRMAAKIASWSATYNSVKGPSNIPRIKRGAVATLGDELAQTRTNPDTVRRAVIVTSSLSKKAVEDAVAEIRNGKAPKPAFVQLYWLLQSFLSACTEVGAKGSVICQP
ncbi:MULTISPECIES: hypothetical protein [Rhizobium]|uniref:hypothetical protein n=1 Tax=Rhizobium TaxID=379 RepID=UPI001FE22378|nr:MULTISPECIES: hypothetical protein [Rhizobium]